MYVKCQYYIIIEIKFEEKRIYNYAVCILNDQF